jgi:peptidoglycan L-alanyl-D-glutamate endopeptidase CwlK
MSELLHRERLKGVHPDLVKVVLRAVENAPWAVALIEGRRTIERQRQLYSQGASTTMDSRHIPPPPPGDDLAKAVDLAPAPDGVASWAWPLYYQFAPLMKAAARELGVDIEWGGDWSRFKDGPHWQLSHKAYP